MIGAGPAGLIAAEEMAKAGIEVTVYERMPSAARKFLLAGRGGLNLTHTEPLEDFLKRYRGSAAHFLRSPIENFPPAKLREWSEALGQKTFEGSSGRVFPEAFKASPLLRAWLRRLDELGVTIADRHRWYGWDEEGALIFNSPKGKVLVKADAVVLALGGASWPRLGSDGSWTEILASAGIERPQLWPANCGFVVDWSADFRQRFEGTPLNRIALFHQGNEVRGEGMITSYGLEGGAIYSLSSQIRDEIISNDYVILYLSLRPDVPTEKLIQRLSAPRGKQSFTNFLRKAGNLPPVAIAILQEWAAANNTQLSALTPLQLATKIKGVPLMLTGTGPIERAISTAGGISFTDLDEDFMFRKLPGVFAAGEMLDWEAPTGGYLLQACFATGVAAGRGAVRWLSR